MSYHLETVLAHRGNFGGARAAEDIKYLVLHYTGNDGDSAINNAKYYQTELPSGKKASAHYFVDDTSVYLSVPERSIAYSVGGSLWKDAAETGGGKMYGVITNANSISIELCDTVKDGSFNVTDATLQNAVTLCREVMAKFHIPLENVYRHFDVTGKHCPAYFMDAEKWMAFKNRLIVDRYQKLEDIPKGVYQDTVKLLMDAGIIGGKKDGTLDLSVDMIRSMIFAYRGGAYDRLLIAKGMEPAVK